MTNVTGLCAPWTPIFTCSLPTGAGTVSGTALQAASETLYALSGRQFGLCTVTLRPCRSDCFQEVLPLPRPELIGGQWFNVACGAGCGDNCGCTSISEVILVGQISAVTAVKVDGVTLTKDVDYRLDDLRRLVRLGGHSWPRCNELNLADTQVGTWSVTVQTGVDVPALGELAVGVLTIEFAKAMLCDNTCQLPKPVQSLARQGVNITFLDPNQVFQEGRTGLYLPDLFITTFNPRGRRQRSRVFNLDASRPRVTNT